MQAAKKLTDTAHQYYADNYIKLKISFQNILKKSVDLPEEKAMKNSYTGQTFID